MDNQNISLEKQNLEKIKNFDIDSLELIKLSNCPYSGLPITCKDSWKNISFTSDYKASFAILGENILLVIPEGDAGDLGKSRFIEARNIILKEFGIWEKPHIEIVDYKYVKSLVSKEARGQFTSHMLAEHLRGYLKAFFGFNARMTFQFMIRIGQMLHPDVHHIPMKMLPFYRDALTKSIDLIKNIQTSENEVNDSLSFNDGIYKLDFKLIDTNIIYNEASGKLNVEHIETFFDYYKKFLERNNLWKKGHFRLINWSGLKYSSWIAKKNYIKEINSFKKNPLVFIVLSTISTPS